MKLQNVTVFGNEAFEHVIKLRRLQGVRVGPLSEEGNWTQHRGRRPGEDRGRGGSDAAIHQGTPKAAGNHQKPGKGKEASFPRVFAGSMALPTH